MKAIFIQQSEKEITTDMMENLEKLFFVFEETTNEANDMYILHHCDYFIYHYMDYLYYYAKLHDIPCIEDEYFLSHYEVISANPNDFQI